jgi:hypothetical protein
MISHGFGAISFVISNIPALPSTAKGRSFIFIDIPASFRQIYKFPSCLNLPKNLQPVMLASSTTFPLCSGLREADPLFSYTFQLRFVRFINFPPI